MSTGLDWLALVLVVLLGGGVLYGALRRKTPFQAAPLLLLLALVARPVGSMARYDLAREFYGHPGDALHYYESGLERSDQLLALDFSFLEEEDRWWGTPALELISGLVLTVVGASIRAEFAVFGLASFLGIAFLVMALARAQPPPTTRGYLLMVAFWPSLLYWACSIGKEAVLVLATGIVTLGYVGDGRRARWGLAVAGIALAFVIRPHYAMVVAAAMAIAELLARRGRLDVRRAIEVVAVGLAALVVARLAFSQLGIEAYELSDVRAFVDEASGQTAQGGGEISLAEGALAVPLAFVNILFRPFLFEAHHVLALGSAIEMTVFWGVVLYRRRTSWAAVRNWRRHRFLRLALPLALLYTLMIGITFSNLGIVARQRVLVLPLLFAFPFAAPPRPRARPRPERGAGEKAGRANASRSPVATGSRP